MSIEIQRPQPLRGSLPVGATTIVILTVVVVITATIRPGVLNNPLAATAATTVVGTVVAWLTGRALRSTQRLRWNPGR
ncbi:hypothetical protein Kpho02_72630 [Kitasatospora phosalacinea]|uniref:Uncharacterized protein n=1 Tax=Kitasatospora phosalacinea TaxID=2065 RepID=A0A9W6QG29_9ACTN|nr:hypothetical protein [Kitasatospora phosalacinea]GLW74966.1 hypothetical protein Kpho02_72630 [Kitasatospora phosalacinea]